VKRALDGLDVASYYGCLLLRPAEVMEFDDVENPRILEDLFEALGAEPIDYPFRTECCGSYLSVGRGDVTTEAATSIVRSISRTSADVIVTSCPMCHYNLTTHVQEASKSDRAVDIPVVYFTQLLAYALGADDAGCGFDPEFARKLSGAKLPMSEVN